MSFSKGFGKPQPSKINKSIKYKVNLLVQATFKVVESTTEESKQINDALLK